MDFDEKCHNFEDYLALKNGKVCSVLLQIIANPIKSWFSFLPLLWRGTKGKVSR